MGRPLAPRACACPPMKRWLAFLPAALLSGAAFAGPADYIYTPAVQYGERELDLKYGATTPTTQGSAQGLSIGVGYGASEHWFTELYVKNERVGASQATLAEWENKFQLTEIGEYPVDVGFVTELEAPIKGEAPREIRLGPLFQTELGKLQLNGNLLFGHSFGGADEGGPANTTVFGYQWQAKYLWRRTLDFGLQGFGETGKWNKWGTTDQQNHRLGPAVMGTLALGGRQVLCYNAAWLFGVSRAAPNHTFRTQVEYEF